MPHLKDLRQIKIAEILAQHNAKSVLDLGCGNGSLLQHLAAQKTFARLCGMDISARNIEEARKRLCALGRRFCADGDIFVSSLTYRDKRFAGHDALVLSEVIEHFERERMDIVMKNILEEARPRLLLLTTPNRAYNAAYGMAENELRHPDHRHEFTEDEFAEFCQGYASRFGYEVEMDTIGEKSRDLGAPTLLGIFKKCE